MEAGLITWRRPISGRLQNRPTRMAHRGRRISRLPGRSLLRPEIKMISKGFTLVLKRGALMLALLLVAAVPAFAQAQGPQGGMPPGGPPPGGVQPGGGPGPAI